MKERPPENLAPFLGGSSLNNVFPAPLRDYLFLVSRPFISYFNSRAGRGFINSIIKWSHTAITAAKGLISLIILGKNS